MDLALSRAEAQRKYHKKMVQSPAYLAKRRAINKKYKLNKKQKGQYKIGLAGDSELSNEIEGSLVAGDVSNHIIKWKSKAPKKFANRMPKYDLGEVSLCPKSLEGCMAQAAKVLQGISKYLDKHWNSDQMKELLDVASSNSPTSITGIRSITGNRYELYVRVKNCTPAGFYTLLRYSEKHRRADPSLVLTEEDLCELVGLIVGFATFRARQLMIPIYSFQNFAYIVSFGEVEQQDVHIDLSDENHIQLGMLCSPIGDLTSEFRCVDREFKHMTGDDLSTLWLDLPKGLQVKLDQFPEVQKLLDGFGPLLSPPSIKKVGQETDMVSFGTIISLPGRVMHCGPKVTKQNKETKTNLVRSILFFTGTPNDEVGSAYDSDTQYCRSTIIHDILLFSWPLLTKKEKKYMLTKWVEVGLSNDSNDAITVNMSHRDLKVIAKALKETPRNQVKQLIRLIANDLVWTNEDCPDKWEETEGEAYKIPTLK